MGPQRFQAVSNNSVPPEFHLLDVGELEQLRAQGCCSLGWHSTDVQVEDAEGSDAGKRRPQCVGKRWVVEVGCLHEN